MVRRITIYIAAIMLIAAAVSCAQNDPSEEITVTELKQMMENEEDFVILDVRTEPELTGPLGKIDGITHIPLHELNKRMDELKPDKDKTIAVVCRSGNRSGKAAAILRAKGYKAYNVKGGMIAYRKNN